MHVIETHNLSKTYGGMLGRSVHALVDVDLEVPAGQAFGLLGPNGAGKTTLVKVLLGLVRPTAGEARLLGRRAGSPASRLRIGYMPERRSYPGFLSAAQVLDLFGRLLGMRQPWRRQRVAEVLEEVEMSPWSGHRVGGFSKGMQQRLALAQALLPDPDVLFLDEPTEGIDPLGRVAIRRILRRNIEHGKSLFINSHMLTEVEKVCERIAILARGRVVRAGPLGELTAGERVYRITVAGEDIEAIRARVPDAAEVGAIGRGLTSLRVGVDDRTHLNVWIDRLRRGGHEIEEILPLRDSLEDVFLHAIRETTSEETPAADNDDSGPATEEPS
jgi:ABC-2 type transport system ATP-binding protein